MSEPSPPAVINGTEECAAADFEEKLAETIVVFGKPDASIEEKLKLMKLYAKNPPVNMNYPDRRSVLRGTGQHGDTNALIEEFK